MRVAVTEFKAKCTEYLRKLPDLDQPIHVTNRGKVVAVVSCPAPKKRGNPIFGALAGTVTYIAEDFDSPLGDDEWEASENDVFT